MRRLLVVVSLIVVAMGAFAALSVTTQAASPNQDTEKVVVFETFGREACTICKAAAPTVDQLADEYGVRAIVVEHDIDREDQPARQRRMKWWNAYGQGGSVTTPLVLVDSGRLHTNGSEDFGRKYRRLIDEALAIDPGVTISAWWDRPSERSLRVRGTVRNDTNDVLGYDNEAQVNILVYEDTEVIHSGRFVRALAAENIEEDIPAGESQQFDITLDIAGTNVNKMHVVVIMDYRPVGSAWQSLNAAFASDEEPLVPTDVPPTNTPEPPTDVPTDEPTEVQVEEPTDVQAPTIYTIFMPNTHNRDEAQQ